MYTMIVNSDKHMHNIINLMIFFNKLPKLFQL